MFEAVYRYDGGREILAGWDWSGELNILCEDDGETIVGSIRATARFDEDGLLIDTDPKIEDYQREQLLELRDKEI